MIVILGLNSSTVDGIGVLFLNIRKPKKIGEFGLEVIKRFWVKVWQGQETDCWIWIGARTNAGYGRFRGDPRCSKFLAHRFSYRQFVGEIPEDFVLMHRCDNPGCVNPVHLTTGNTQENVWDRINKGRHGGCVEVKNKCPFEV